MKWRVNERLSRRFIVDFEICFFLYLLIFFLVHSSWCHIRSDSQQHICVADIRLWIIRCPYILHQYVRNRTKETFGSIRTESRIYGLSWSLSLSSLIIFQHSFRLLIDLSMRYWEILSFVIGAYWKSCGRYHRSTFWCKSTIAIPSFLTKLLWLFSTTVF